MVRLVKHVRNDSAHGQQWRLLLLILPLGLVILLMARLRDPQMADRINRFFAPIKPRPLVAEIPAPNVGAQPEHLFPGISRELLASVKDNTYFRDSEQEAWFHFIDVLLRTPAEQVTSERAVPVAYTQLVDQPDAYRGRLVSMHGTVRQVTKQKPAANDLGLEFYYRVVVQPSDGVPWPIFVYCLEMDADRPEGGLTGRVRVTGLFFKNLSYSWEDGLGTAPVVVARSLKYLDSTAAEPHVAIRPPVAVDDRADIEPQSESERRQPANKSAELAVPFRELLKLAGWSAERLAQFDDGRPLSDDQRLQAVALLRRLRSFNSASLDEWAHADVAPHVLTNPDDFRGELIRLSGRVTRVAKHALNAADAERLESSRYFECEMALDDAKTAIVLTGRVPDAWLQMAELDEPATANALLLKPPSNDSPAKAIWLSKEMAWHPKEVNEPYVSLGESLLGNHGMDVGLLDSIRSRGRIRAAEREAFYQMLDAAGRIGPQRLVRLAERNLPSVREAWERELESATDDPRRQLAREVVERAAAGRYSVAPLFNDPEPQIGRLIVVDGAARRVVRVDVGARPQAGGPSDVERRFGIDHYYELELFTDDSQNYPIVFCARELPAGFPISGSVHVPVRVAGFFFKDWLYHTRGSRQSEVAGGRAQYAPLLIGRAPLVLAEAGGKDASQLVLGVLFIAAVGGICAVAAWFARGDRRFRASVLAERFSLPPGQSLNEINLPAADEPMKE